MNHSTGILGCLTESSVACRLRDIFVDERMGLSRAAGPENHQAAMLMGNTVQTWEQHYDKNYAAREAQAGVDAMADWRQDLLGRPDADRSVRPQKIGPVVADTSGILVALDEEYTEEEYSGENTEVEFDDVDDEVPGMSD